MKVWILDDSHFPTGYANGAIKERYPQYKKRYLKLHQLDFVGANEMAQAIIKYAFTDKDDKLIGVYLAKKKSFTQIDESSLADISSQVDEIVIELTTTLVRSNYDWLSQFMLLEPNGLCDDIYLEIYQL